MDNFDDFMKQLSTKTKDLKDDDSDDDEDDIDDELAKIEKEIEMENQQQNVNVNKQVRPQQQPHNKPAQEQDIYSIGVEHKYHNVQFMKSISTLEEEKRKCDDIIKYKQQRNKPKDVEYWQAKIKQIDIKITATTDLIETGKLDIETYKNVIQQALTFEQGFLKQITQDTSLTPSELQEIKLRISKRIELIQAELSEEINEDSDEPEVPEQQPEQPPQTQPTTPAPQPSSSEKPKANDNKANTEQLNQLHSRLNEYKSAYEYFKSNALSSQEKDALSKTQLLHKLIQRASSGEQLPPNAIPKVITKEYIYGYSQQDKVNRLKVLLQEKIQLRNRLNAELQRAEKHISQKDKKDVKKIDQILQKEISKRQSDLNAVVKEINDLKQIAASHWTPAPLIAKKEKEIKKEVSNEKIPLNVLQVHIGNTTYDKDKVYVEIKITYSGKVQCQKVHEIKKGEFNQTATFTFDKKEFKALYRNNLDIKIYRKKSIRDAVKGDAVVSLEKLKNKISFTTNAEIRLESKRYKPTLEVKVDTRTPCVDAMYESVKVVSLEVVKVYPEFKVVKAQQPIANKNTTSTTSTNNTQTTSKANTSAIANVKLSKEEIENPDVIENIITIQVLEYKINEYTDKINKIEGRTPKELRTFLVKLKVKKTQLEESLGNDISPSDYLTGIQHQLDHDKALYVHFNTSNQPEKAELVKKRIGIMLKEKKEMEAYISNPQ